MKLALGTAQFGLNYGIANSVGQVDFEKTQRILQFAFESGIDTLDTASAYGNSEMVLGSAGVRAWNIITKIPALPAGEIDVEHWVLDQVDSSMLRLGVDKLQGLLLHHPADLLGEAGPSYVRAIHSLLDSGNVEAVGYSIYSPSILNELAPLFWPKIVQVPYNIFDQRIRTSGWLQKLSSAGTKIHARSIFLQGLLLMREVERPTHFRQWRDLLQRWSNRVDAHEMSATALALNFVASESLFDRIIVGVDSLEQLKQIIDVPSVNVGSQLADLACDDVDLIEPFRWPKN
jgi:aryl-alcohol dehydrogenase-like predicted oxidoreductase